MNANTTPKLSEVEDTKFGRMIAIFMRLPGVAECWDETIYNDTPVSTCLSCVVRFAAVSDVMQRASIVNSIAGLFGGTAGFPTYENGLFHLTVSIPL